VRGFDGRLGAARAAIQSACSGRKTRAEKRKSAILFRFLQKNACAGPGEGFNSRESQDPNETKDNRNNTMAKTLSKSQIAASIAETAEITKKQAVLILDHIVQLAYKNAKNSFTLPGLGKLVLVNRKARIGRNPATGEQIQIPAKKVVKFRVAKAAKDAILGKK
jgi:DNA-binding protein HU-beta